MLSSKTDPFNQSVQYTYTNGLARTRTWARGGAVTTTYTYNGLGEMLATAYSDGTPGFQLTNSVDDVGYNRAGQPQRIDDASGSWVFLYDAMGDPLGAVCTNGLFSGIAVTNRIHPAYGRDLLRVEIPGHSAIEQEYGYESSGRLSSAEYNGVVVNYAYLPQSDLLATNTFASSSMARMTTVHTWEHGQRLKSVESFTTNRISRFHYDYDARNRRWRATLNNNARWIYTYNDRDEVAGGVKQLATGAEVPRHAYNYTYDTIGNRQVCFVGSTNLTLSYTANAANQYNAIFTDGGKEIVGIAAEPLSLYVNGYVPERQNELFYRRVAVDNASGPVWQEVTVNAGTNTASGHFLFPPYYQVPVHDADGNLILDGLWSYAWDGENRLKKMESASEVPEAAKRKLEFSYDGQGRRIGRGLSVYTNSAWVLISSNLFVYDGWNLIAELNATNKAPVRSYLWGRDLSGTLDGAGGIGGLVVLRDHASGENHLPFYDGNGNIMGLVKAADQSRSAQYWLHSASL